MAMQSYRDTGGYQINPQGANTQNRSFLSTGALQPQKISVSGSPATQTDWPVSQFIPSRTTAIAAQVLGTALVLTTLVSQDSLPFRQRDWPLPTPAKVISIGVASQPLGSPDNLTLYPGQDSFPIRQREWPNPRGNGPPQQPIVDGSFAALRALIVSPPFFQNEWPNPKGFLRYDAPLGQPLGTPDNLTLYIGLDLLPVRSTDRPNPRGPQQPTQTQPYGSPDNLTLLPGQDAFPVRTTDRPNPIGPLQPTQTQPFGSALSIVTVPPTPYLMAQWDWPNPRGSQQPAQITTWAVPLPILVTIPQVVIETQVGGHFISLTEKQLRELKKRQRKDDQLQRKLDNSRKLDADAIEADIRQTMFPAGKGTIIEQETVVETDEDESEDLEILLLYA